METVYVVLLMLINFSFYSGNYQAKILRVVNLFVHKNTFFTLNVFCFKRSFIERLYNLLSFFFLFPGLGLKERLQILAQHNRLRSRVQPMAANMQKMVSGIYCVLLLGLLNGVRTVSSMRI